MVDFLLTAKRDRREALRFLHKSIDQCGMPQKITIDKSRANGAAIETSRYPKAVGPDGTRYERKWVG